MMAMILVVMLGGVESIGWGELFIWSAALSHEQSFNEDCNKIIDNLLITV